MNEYTPEELGLKAAELDGGGSSDRRIGFYSISRVLGRGGMGEVLKALDTRSGRTVALKLIDTAGAADPETLRRFEREARAAAHLDHPNIARMFGMEFDEKKHPFIVMEYIDGESLETIVVSPVNRPFSVLCDYIIQTARGLEAAHRKSIIHRDIKPGNLLVDHEGNLKIIDFGLAKSMFDRTALTTTGMVVGTPRYIAPEQALGRAVDHRADIYSLGATFYELVTHQSPFEGDSAMSIMMKHVSTPLVPPYMINPKVPGDISEIITRMMAKDPGERYQDYEALIRDLESAKIHRMAKEQRQQLATPASLDAVGETSHRPSSYLTEGFVDINVAELPDGEPPVPRAKLVLLSLVGLVILAVAGASFLQARGAAERGEPSWVGRALVSVFSRGEPKKVMTPEDLVRLDTERVNATVRRMEAAIGKLVDHNRTRQDRSRMVTVRELREKGVLTSEESRDGWGNDFVITTAHGGVLMAAGRDRAEDTEDDFRFSVSGQRLQIPRPLTLDDAAVILQTAD